MIIKTIINLVEITILVKILYRIGAFFLVRKKYGKYKKGKSIAGKIGMLMSNKVHDMLDNMIKAQKAKRLEAKEPQVNNEVIFKVYKGSKAN